MTTNRPAIIGVMGPSACTAELAAKAEELGRLIAAAGHTLLCGGGSGVMEASAKGARSQDGLTVGIMPGRDAADSPPNPYIQVPVYTGMSEARNLVNVLTADVVVAVGGAYGTLSEIALALKCGKPVLLLDSWECTPPDSELIPKPVTVSSPRDAITAIGAILT